MKTMLLLCSFSLCASVLAAASPRLGLVINEDNSHFYGCRLPAHMTLEGLHAFVDQYADTSVTHLFLCPNAMRTSYDSDVWDAIWDPTENPRTEKQRAGNRWAMNAKRLADRGLDPYAIWIGRCREKGLSPWLSMRMNDVHDVSNPENFMHSTFWLLHPEYHRVPGAKSGSWQQWAFDYGVPAVREHHLKLIRELLERYDPDGIELDWMRFGWHFKPGREAEGAAILTGFMRSVRELANERARPVKVSARVPTHPDAARGLGMDGVAWVKEGLVDMLVPSPFWSSSDFDIPIELWREQIGETAARVVIAAGLEHGLAGYPGGKRVSNTLESMRGFAAAHLHRGADQIYLFNYMDPAPIAGGRPAYRQLVEDGLSLDTVSKLPRRHIVTYRDTVPPGFPRTAVLPASAQSKPRIKIYIGPAPKAGRASFVVGLAKKEGYADAALAAAVNGVSCTSATDLEKRDGLPPVARAIVFDCPIAAMHDGYNELEVEQEASQPEQQIIWAEIRIAPQAG